MLRQQVLCGSYYCAMRQATPPASTVLNAICTYTELQQQASLWQLQRHQKVRKLQKLYQVHLGPCLHLMASADALLWHSCSSTWHQMTLLTIRMVPMLAPA